MNADTTSFGPFVVDRGRRVLLCDGAAVALTPKAFDVLVTLMDRAGTVVRKEELFRAVWPDTIVDENNLAFQISTLRKALGEKERGERYIATVPGQGYQLLVPLHTAERSEVVLQEDETVTVTVEETSISRRLVALVIALVMVSIGAVAVGLWLLRSRDSSGALAARAPGVVRSMAILPFRPIVAVQTDEALQLGMADALIGRISKAHGIAVRPLSAVRRYGALEQDPLAAGRELQVDAVLDGTIHHAAGRIRVTARLLRVADAQQVWQGQFEEGLSGIFTVQDSISQRLAAELSLSEAEQPKVHRPANVEAYRAYALGVMHVQRLRREEIDAGIRHFRRATELDPQYAAAYAATAGAYAILPISSDAPPQENFRAARIAAKKALALDPNLAEAHVALGTIAFWSDWDWVASEESFRRAATLEPGNATARTRYAHLLSNVGRHDEARAQIGEALRLDPLSRMVNTLAGQFHLQAGNLDAGISQLEHALRIDPDFWIARLNLGKAYEQQRRFDDALREFHRAHRGAGQNVGALAMIGYTHGLRGDRAAARQTLAELMAIARARPIAATKIALVHLGLGDREEAIRWLRRACDERDVGLTFLRANPRWSELRGHPGYDEIERCVNLPQ